MTETQPFLYTDIREFKKRLDTAKSLIGVDYGNVRIGLAISDTRRTLSSPLKTISKITDLDPIITDRSPAGFVIGLPLEPAGTEGKMAAQVRLFATRLIEKFRLPVLLVDERYTSLAAAGKLRGDLNLSGKKLKAKLDTTAAADLLQEILNQL